ncbi:hypothetical protein HHE02_02160 [Helicobacter heilmannii]|nr:hypothetical protein NHP21011_13900 [Helicobacter heilmannii]CRF46934.1 hypothetical protein HHE02_02160 [Helicobacter heilmannii]
MGELFFRYFKCESDRAFYDWICRTFSYQVILGDKMNVCFITGFLGRFTTFSSFGHTLKLLQKQAITEALVYIF